MNAPVFDGYRIVRKLGSGGMGDVYEAVDEMLERPVALKVLRPEIAGQPELIERFRVEAVALAKLHHASIATLYAFFQQQGRYCMAMEFVRGGTLEALLSGPARLDHPRVIALMGQTLDGIAHAHSMGVMHRDIKPANIMVTAEGAVKVTDFGIARILGASRMTREGRIIGTLEYIAPERIRGVESDFRSDLYSAGVVLYEMLAGRLPFVSETDYGLLEAHMHQAPPRLIATGIACPPALEEVVRRAMEKQPEDRFQSCEEFRQALLAVLPDCAAGSPKATRLALPATRLAATPAGSARRPRLLMRKPVLAGIAMAVLSIGVGLLAYFLGRPAAPAAPAPVAQTVPAPVAAPVDPPQPVQQPQPEPLAVIPAATPEAPVAQPARPAPVHRVAPPAPAAPAAIARSQVQARPVAPAVAAPQVPAPTAPPAPAAAVPDPAPAPVARTAPRRLDQVRKLFVADMDDQLDEFIRREIREQLGGQFTLVDRRGAADAILSGGGSKRGGVGSKLSLGFRAGYQASVAIRDAAEGHLLWSAEADDARPGLGSIKRGGPKRVAEKLVEILQRTLNGGR
jgi:serine/threonine-protein kinase